MTIKDKFIEEINTAIDEGKIVLSEEANQYLTSLQKVIEKPKFIPYREQVIHSIAETLNVSDDKVFIKAKTGEKLGDVGNSKCIEVFANCLISKNK